MRSWFTRDGALLWCLAVAALASYLKTVGVPPWQWSYDQWLQFLIAFAAWGIGKLQNSSWPSKAEVTSLGSVTVSPKG